MFTKNLIIRQSLYDFQGRLYVILCIKIKKFAMRTSEGKDVTWEEKTEDDATKWKLFDAAS